MIDLTMMRRLIGRLRSVMSTAYLARGLGGTLLAVSLAGGTMDTAADQQDPRLGELFVALVEAPDSATAVTIEAAIWQIWLDGGDATVASPH